MKKVKYFVKFIYKKFEYFIIFDENLNILLNLMKIRIIGNKVFIYSQYLLLETLQVHHIARGEKKYNLSYISLYIYI